MTLHNPNPNPNAFVRFMRKIYHPIGFHKGYNFILWFIFSGALFGFVLARLQYLDINGKFAKGAAPGEWYWYSQSYYKIGITLHLAAILPAGLLALLQFVPAIRHKARLFHRLNGYVVVLLVLIANVGALMITRHAFGGSLPTQAGVGVLAIGTTISMALAYYNIKRLQIDQHRAWMLRTWFYLGTIITLRIIMIIATVIVSQLNSFHVVVSCKVIAFIAGKYFLSKYPACVADPVNGFAAVRANLTNATNAMEAGAGLEVSFGMAMWLGILLHAVGVEIYLRLTPAEGERLRQVSYERQLERGFSHPGSSGLPVDRLGDCEPWMPKEVKVEKKMSLTTSDEEEDVKERSSETVDGVRKPASAVLGWRS